MRLYLLHWRLLAHKLKWGSSGPHHLTVSDNYKLNIYIDESGSFSDAPSHGAWNCIVAYMSPEIDRKKRIECLAQLKMSAGIPAKKEAKLKCYTELQIFSFLENLGQLKGVMYVVATDAGMNHAEYLLEHQKIQVEKMREHLDKMIYEEGRYAVRLISNNIACLSPQLYVQLQCQFSLIDSVIRDGVLYFVQRTPKSLGRFRWRIDQKNTTKINYESAFEDITPGVLQSSSIKEPMAMLKSEDYSAFNRFDYLPEDKPTYLKDIYGLEVNEDETATDVGKLMREDLMFVDSKKSLGVQVSDLLASSVRRCLRQEFSNNEKVAWLLGKIMVQRHQKKPPIQFLGFSPSDQLVSDDVAKLLRIMDDACRAMLR